jgi:hypothetical protein
MSISCFFWPTAESRFEIAEICFEIAESRSETVES